MASFTISFAGYVVTIHPSKLAQVRIIVTEIQRLNCP